MCLWNLGGVVLSVFVYSNAACLMLFLWNSILRQTRRIRAPSLNLIKSIFNYSNKWANEWSDIILIHSRIIFELIDLNIISSSQFHPFVSKQYWHVYCYFAITSRQPQKTTTVTHERNVGGPRVCVAVCLGRTQDLEEIVASPGRRACWWLGNPAFRNAISLPHSIWAIYNDQTAGWSPQMVV